MVDPKRSVLTFPISAELGHHMLLSDHLAKLHKEYCDSCFHVSLLKVGEREAQTGRAKDRGSSTHGAIGKHMIECI
uniref:AlNc14C86G5507 protein n=1 Tax=Albugo laibachii Nc14 TaxID=890382 RepID=F0WFX3_9STRA|nr:AlNc14C86G5507 [Albugo laibachii Nc14]|eukprot:CCA20107.1 AlNc14C86G5507 [Albugo laibachii Nc14]